MKSATIFVLALLSGCASIPICPEIKLAMCPAEAQK